MKIIECEQGSPEWLEYRRGIPTSSEFKRIITPVKGELSSGADGYIFELIAEQYHLGSMDELSGPATAAMRNGLIMEPEARKWYEFVNGCEVKQVGFVITNCGRFGCSPDGLVVEDGGVEIKCPHGKTHVEYLLNKVLPSEYKCQVHGHMAVTGRAWWDFMSYCPGLPEFIIRVHRDEFTDKMLAALESFDARRKEIMAQLDLPAPPEPEKPETITREDLPPALYQ